MKSWIPFFLLAGLFIGFLVGFHVGNSYVSHTWTRAFAPEKQTESTPGPAASK